MSSKVRRFAYVYTLVDSARVHLSYEQKYWIEGPTACGLHTGEGWWFQTLAKNLPRNRSICARCRP